MNKDKTMCLIIDGNAKAFLTKTPSTMGHGPIYLCVIEDFGSGGTIKRLKKVFQWFNIGESLDSKGNGGVQFHEVINKENKHPVTGVQLYDLKLELEFIDFLRSKGFGVKQIPKI